MTRKLTETEAGEVKWLMALQSVLTARRIADEYGISETQVRRIHRGVKWRKAEPIQNIERMESPTEALLQAMASSSSPSAPQECARPIAIQVPAWTNSWMQLTADSDARTLTPSDSQQHSS